METNQTDFRNQQSDSKSNQNSPVSSQEKSSNKVEDLEENKVKKTIPRRPQFRLNENLKRKFR